MCSAEWRHLARYVIERQRNSTCGATVQSASPGSRVTELDISKMTSLPQRTCSLSHMWSPFTLVALMLVITLCIFCCLFRFRQMSGVELTVKSSSWWLLSVCADSTCEMITFSVCFDYSSWNLVWSCAHF